MRRSDWRVRAARMAVVVLPVLVAIGSWTATRRYLPWELVTGDERQYAVIARQLARGHGFTTSIVYPAELRWGVDADHPSLLCAPLWPVVLAGVFAITGPSAAAAHLMVLVFYVATVVAATALAVTLSGWGAALVAGFAVALSPDLRVVSLFAATEAQFAFLVMLLFVALARWWPPVWIGVLCGLAYLTRYNGGLLLPLALILLADRPRFARAALHGIAGFLVVCVPWWVRNLTVTGDPFFSLYSLVVHSPLDLRTNSNLLHALDPPSTFPTAGLLNKLRITLPTAFLHSPLLLANLPAALGVLIGTVQRDRWCLGLLAIAVAMTAIGATVGALGRYVVPLLPVLLVLGVVRWWRLDVRIRAPALLLLLLAPALPSVADELPDMGFAKGIVVVLRSDSPTPFRADGRPPEPLAACLRDAPLVAADDASKVAWIADTVAIWMTTSEADFWRLVDQYRIDFVQLSPGSPLRKSVPFQQRFALRADCGAELFERRPPPS